MALQEFTRMFGSNAETTDERPADRTSEPTGAHEERPSELARRMAEATRDGFRHHDRRRREEAVDAFYVVDVHQFPHIEDEVAYDAAEAYVEALWRKDAIEEDHLADGEIDPDSIADADFTPVYDPLARRADLLGVDELYASRTAEAWHLHEAGGDYWTPFLEAQTMELRAAMGEAYPEGTRGGRSGYGSLAARYLVGVELHDAHDPTAWEEAVEVMTTYYRHILDSHP